MNLAPAALFEMRLWLAMVWWIGRGAAEGMLFLAVVCGPFVQPHRRGP